MSKSLFKAGGVVSLMTLVSRVLGLVRDVVLAHLVGASAHADVFLLAQKIPNFLRRLFAEGAFAQAFVPVLNETLVQDGKPGVQALIDRVAGTLGGVLLILTCLAIIGSPAVAGLFGMGFWGQPEKFWLLSLMIKITFPYLLFISLTAFAGGILNTYGQFAVPAITPVLLNISMIVAAIWVAPSLSEPVMALPWAVFVAGVLQLLFQLPFLWRLGLLPKPKWDWKHSGVRKILKLITPALFGVSVTQINLLLDSILASFLVTGSISWLYYSDRLLEFPLGIFGIGIATVILPTLSRQYSQSADGSFAETLNWAIRMVLMVGIPAAVGLIILAEPLLLTLFQRGAFTVHDATQAAASLMAYTLGLNAFMLIKVLAPGFYSRQDTSTPVRIAIRAMVINMMANLALFWWLGHVGLALATSLSAIANASMLWRALRRDGLSFSAGIGRWSLKIAVASSMMLLAVDWLNPEMSWWQHAALIDRVWQISKLCVFGVAVYIVGLWVSGIRPAHLHTTA
ncbi:MAG: murein biosynthesis integral membrane protein MurJ [Gammaproteobacteria bacterium]|nr:MAG: murein biosynthesis integral membrane protein MurJ [Gammaproteobacteria bacterium]